MGVAVECSLESGLQQLHQILKPLESFHIYLTQHLCTRTITIKDITFTHTHTHTSHFYFLNVWKAGELTNDTCEVVSLFTKSGVGRDTICSKGGGFQIVGSVPAGKVTGLTSKKGGTPKCSIPIAVKGSDIPCEL